jgi:hypothetical protein
VRLPVHPTRDPSRLDRLIIAIAAFGETRINASGQTSSISHRLEPTRSDQARIAGDLVSDSDRLRPHRALHRSPGKPPESSYPGLGDCPSSCRGLRPAMGSNGAAKLGRFTRMSGVTAGVAGLIVDSDVRPGLRTGRDSDGARWRPPLQWE